MQLMATFRGEELEELYLSFRIIRGNFVSLNTNLKKIYGKDWNTDVGYC